MGGSTLKGVFEMSCLTELAPITDLGHYGNIFIRRMNFESVGQILQAHRHNFDHATFIGAGAVQVRFFKPDGSASLKIYEGPTWFEVPKDVGHEIMALSVPVVCFCVFAVRDPDGEVAEVVTEAHLKNSFYHYREGQGHLPKQ
jgi:hypothetical protein